MGVKFQADDDFLDCFGDENVTGKKETDIADCKCSWLALRALRRMSAAQRARFERHYERESEEDVKEVKGLYEMICLSLICVLYCHYILSFILRAVQCCALLA